MAVSRSDTTRTRYFAFFAPKTYNVNRIGGYYNTDTTVASTASTTRVTLKTYTFTASQYTNKIRVRIYASVSGGTGSVYLNINGTDVASNTNITSTSATLVIDYIGDLKPGTSYTIKVDGSMSISTSTLSISKVVIIAGYGLTSTTPVTIYTNTSVEKYTIYDNSNGGFRYQVGIRYWIQFNRKTTAIASLTVNGSAPQNGGLVIYASDDGDNLTSAYGTVDYSTSLTLAGNVGASGDVIIVVGFYYQVTLQGNQSTPHLSNTCCFVSTLKGKHSVTAEWFGWNVGSSLKLLIDSSNLASYVQVYASGSYLNGVVNLAEAVGIDYLMVHLDGAENRLSLTGFIWLEVVVYV